MEVGITHLVLRGQGELAAVADSVRAAGYAGMEVLFTPDGDITPASSAADLARVRELFAAAGLRLQSMCMALPARGSLVTGVEADVERFVEAHHAAARACAELGIDTLLIIPGGVTPDIPYDLCYDRALAGLRRLIPAAEATGVSFAVEYVWNDMFLSPLELRACLDAVDHPRVGFYMDTGNMMAFGYAEQWIRILGPHIKKVHLKNFRRRPHWSWPSLLAEGDADWPRIRQALAEAGYDGPLISEMSGTWDEHAANAEFIQTFIGLDSAG
jgi:hexulose-6-phosphate isomerase